jgi:D-alanyl-D-alanine carboxypeptidase
MALAMQKKSGPAAAIPREFLMIRPFRLALTLAPLALSLAGAARAEPYLVADFDSGDVLMQSDATEPWFPASTTKLMTVYVALSAVRDGRLTMDTPLTMSSRAARLPPSKMGFRPGTLVTLDNALKMLMVKSPNDVAWMIAESLDGSVDKFADEMNAAAAKLGMRESHFVNPNGLHDPQHYSSARDMAILARALLKEFPDHADLYNIGELAFGGQLIRNHNGLLGAYPGADGMKTGFTCPAGWNVVATAQRDGRKLIVVVYGAPTPRVRNNEAALLFDRGFAMSASGQKLDALPASAVTSPPDMRDDICHGRRKSEMAEMQEEFVASAMAQSSAPFTAGQGAAMLATAMEAPPSGGEKEKFEPVPVFVGAKPGWTGPVLAARDDDAPASPVSAFADKDAKPDEAGAPMVLKSVVKPPVKARRAHMTPQARARVAAAGQREAAKRVTKKPHH